ncbi:MAG TPA: hypothetical protein VLE91_04585 [Candidatus Saccharimonadales bacterium]|nr:hypothetical protein [Candidatus Saccharimonadales bacterium]
MKPQDDVSVETTTKRLGEFIRDNYPEVDSLPINIFTADLKHTKQFVASVKPDASISLAS